ncbi:putative Basement membrane-specific heparan sulfate proteoglycan core protein [Hypsibius exemplaris]|uniref:Basement membrane-specific heparan sulfate proteoglycan core protein n=1 Tax=Hypsibius exemplaris TaxID=2072580 RepID=A0A1W0WCT7_HYPEX|nr:putative Basement membrane-specific heparan sulfate proteoglycan core protein [Hypsibius exemplaris]
MAPSPRSICIFIISVSWTVPVMISGQGLELTTPPAPSNDSVSFQFTANLTSVRFTPELGSLDDLQFKLVSHEIAERFTALFQDLPGHRTAVIEKFEETGDGSLVSVHFNTSVFQDQYEIESRLKVALKSGFLGRFKTTLEGFRITQTTESANVTLKWKCPPDSFWCSDGGCVAWVQRCDGNMDCADHSDEGACEATLVELEARPVHLVRQAGKRAQFFCGSKDFRHRVKWFRNGAAVDDVRAPNVLQKKGRLQITALTLADSGEYLCKAQNSLEGSSATVNLTVVPHGRQMINCPLPEEGAEVQWSKLGGRLPEGSNVTGGSLHLYNLALADAGFYECLLATAEPNDEHWVVRTFAAKARFQPKVAPTNLTVYEGQPFAFHCNSTKDGVNVEWTRSLLRIPKRFNVARGRMSSGSAQTSDTGKYYCNHREGPSTERVAVFLTVLERKVPIIDGPRNVTLEEGETVSFVCLATRDNTTVDWLHGRTGERLTSMNGTLTAFSVSLTDSGDYFCQHSGREDERLSVSLTVRPRSPTLTETEGGPSGKMVEEKGDGAVVSDPPFGRRGRYYLPGTLYRLSGRKQKLG